MKLKILIILKNKEEKTNEIVWKKMFPDLNSTDFVLLGELFAKICNHLEKKATIKIDTLEIMHHNTNDDVKKIYPDKYKFPITLREKVDDNEDEFEILEKIKSKKLKSSGNEKEKKKEKTFCQNWIIDMLDKGSLDKFVKFFNF